MTTHPKPAPKLRLDKLLVAAGHTASRERAHALILAGRVLVDNQRIDKPGTPVTTTAAIRILGDDLRYVSRGGLKLERALAHWAIDLSGLACLDVGASTGGFTEVLLAGGAARVYAVDVGHAQMNPRLARDPRIVRKDGVNARDLTTEQVPEPVQAIVADVSFIGLKLVLPPALVLAAPDAWVVALVKPQFEIGRWAVGKGGIVRDAEAQAGAIAEIEKFLNQQAGWTVLGHIESPITGGDGNREFLIAAQRG